MQNILNADGNFLTFEEFQNKFQVKTNYLRYFQLMAAMPSELKRKAKAFGTLPHELLDTAMIFSSTGTAPLDQTKMRCKHYYKILNESYTTEPTGIKNWKRNYPNLFTN